MGLALITGASSGIGFELARQFAQDGYDLVIAADDDEIHTAATTLKSSGVEVEPVQVDLRKPDNVEKPTETQRVWVAHWTPPLSTQIPAAAENSSTAIWRRI